MIVTENPPPLTSIDKTRGINGMINVLCYIFPNNIVRIIKVVCLIPGIVKYLVMMDWGRVQLEIVPKIIQAITSRKKTIESRKGVGLTFA